MIERIYMHGIVYSKVIQIPKNKWESIRQQNRIMNEIFVMVPLARIASSCPAVITKYITEILQLESQAFQVHELTTRQSLKREESDKNKQYCVKILDFDLSFLEINSIVQQSQKLQKKISLLQATLENFTEESRAINSSLENMSQSVHLDQLIKKAKKAKELKEQNKKLKKLLQVQLENTQKVREETQKTMKNLKEEFDALVNEMTHKENLDKGGKSVRNPHSHRDH